MPPVPETPHASAHYRLVWAWRGTHAQGQSLQGYLCAAGPAHLRAVLRRCDIKVHRVRRAWVMQAVRALSSLLWGGPHDRALPVKDMANMTRQLATLLNAGMPLLSACEITAQSALNMRAALVMHMIASDLRRGMRLSSAMRRQTPAFDALTCYLIEASEAAGALGPTLLRIADDQDRARVLRKKLHSAMMYPVTVLGVAVGVMGVILTWVVPAFEQVYQALGAELPAATQMLLTLGKSTRERGPTLIVCLALWGVLVARALRHRPDVKRRMARWALHLPGWGAFISHAALARWSRTLCMLTASGLPLTSALELVGPASGHPVFEQATRQASQQVSLGHTLSSALQSSQAFPPLLVRWVAVGEQAGQLGPMLARVAQFHEESVETLSQGLTTLMEPALMLIMGTWVGAAVLALYWPMFNLGAAL